MLHNEASAYVGKEIVAKDAAHKESQAAEAIDAGFDSAGNTCAPLPPVAKVRSRDNAPDGHSITDTKFIDLGKKIVSNMAVLLFPLCRNSVIAL